MTVCCITTELLSKVQDAKVGYDIIVHIQLCSKQSWKFNVKVINQMIYMLWPWTHRPLIHDSVHSEWYDALNM